MLQTWDPKTTSRSARIPSPLWSSPTNKSKLRVFWVLRTFSIHTSRSMLLGLPTYTTCFDLFKTAIQNTVILHFPDYTLLWIVRSDSSDYAVGSVLFKGFTSPSGSVLHHPIAFASHKCSGAAVNWDIFEQEAYALYLAVTQFNYYFLLEMHHRNLIRTENSQDPLVIRKLILLQSYTFAVKHIPGADNCVADWLSRLYPTQPTKCSISLPDAGVHVSIRISMLYLRVYVLCTYSRTDRRPLVWNVAVCTACCSDYRNTHTHRCNIAVGYITVRYVATPVKCSHNSIGNFVILSFWGYE